MNLRKDPEGTIRALAAVEGERWLERQRTGDFKGCSVFDAIEELGRVPGDGPHAGEWSIDTVIYGMDGWNRYRVRMDGEVQFIEAQAWGRAAVARAKHVGFEIV